MAVPYTFASATSPIPLSQLDSNFGTTITLGNTAIQLGNTVTQLNNMTLANVTISTVSTAITASQGGTGLTAAGNSGNVLVSNGTTWTSAPPANRVTSIADGTSVTINGDTTDIATQTNTQAVGTLTINSPSGTPFNGQKLIFRLQSTNVQTFSWNSIFAGSTDVALPTASTGSSKYDYMGFMYNSTATKWQIIAKNFGF